MSKYVDVSDQVWDTAEVVGATMDRCVLWGGEHQVFAGFFRLPAGMSLPLHHHSEWVQILILEGRMEVTLKGAEPRRIGPGGYYFVEPGDSHAESAVEDSLLLVVAEVAGPMRAGTVLP